MTKAHSAIPVIDLFAGPGGLSEGFSSFVDTRRQCVFKIKLAIEKDGHAHSTLVLRAFFRQFPEHQRPKEYYDYLAGQISKDELFNLYRCEAEAAAKEAWLAELGGSFTPGA